MKTRYVTTNLNLMTKIDITKLIKFDFMNDGFYSYKNLLIHSVKMKNNFWNISVSRPENQDATIEVEFSEYINFLKKLFRNKKISKKKFKKIEFDMAFDSGFNLPGLGFNIPNSILSIVSILGGSVNITIYPVEV
jgi:hypothetical protein